MSPGSYNQSKIYPHRHREKSSYPRFSTMRAVLGLRHCLHPLVYLLYIFQKHSFQHLDTCNHWEAAESFYLQAFWYS
jgi:hypothetical protein